MRILSATCLAFLIVSSVVGAAPSLQEFRDFAMTHDGDSGRGRELFFGEGKSGCTKCHTVDGTGGKAGPDLGSIGDTFPRGELIRAILEPSATIAVGYGATIVESKSGEEYVGVIKNVSDAWIELVSADGKLIRIATADIKQQRGSNVSLMPEGLHSALSLGDFSDL